MNKYFVSYYADGHLCNSEFSIDYHITGMEDLTHIASELSIKWHAGKKVIILNWRRFEDPE